MSFRERQRDRSLHHPTLQQHSISQLRYGTFSFVVCADTQLGIINDNRDWETELSFAQCAVNQINALRPRPLFCCCCGDLVDMESSFYINDNKSSKGLTKEMCDDIQDRQNQDFQELWSSLHEDIALVCLCGNHDVGNRPTSSSIQRFQDAFGDDYLAFWACGSYNVVLNTCLFSNPDGAFELYEKQLNWLEERLKYAATEKAGIIFIFGHHPWFLYHEEEEKSDLLGISPYPVEWNITEPGGFPDSYFHIPKEYRMRVMQLCEEYQVAAAFSGHFHQNLLSKASFGMEMIITTSLSLVFNSTGKTLNFSSSDEPTGLRGIRVVDVDIEQNTQHGKFSHRFIPLDEKGLKHNS
jgi:serine/threonine-protein phosphatase CPPED1